MGASGAPPIQVKKTEDANMSHLVDDTSMPDYILPLMLIELVITDLKLAI